MSDYLKSPRVEDINENFDPVKWWSERQNKSPILCKIAKDYLAMMVTSVPSERTFSQGGLTVTKSRTQLHSQTVRELICLKSWIDL